MVTGAGTHVELESLSFCRENEIEKVDGGLEKVEHPVKLPDTALRIIPVRLLSAETVGGPEPH